MSVQMGTSVKYGPNFDWLCLLSGVPVHTGTPVKYGPMDDEEGHFGDEWGLRETRVQVSYLHPDLIETQGKRQSTRQVRPHLTEINFR